MEFNIQKEKFSLCESGNQGNQEHAIDCDITLPEYLPDIIKILKCSCIPGVKSHQVNGDRITAECNCIVRVLYTSEQGNLHCYEQNIPFAKQIELKSDHIPTDIFVGAKTDYVNYRVSGQRRFEIHGALTVFAKTNSKKCVEMISDACGDGVTLKTEKVEICDLCSVIEKAFTVTETCDVGALSEPMGSVVASCSFGIINELKIVSDKLFLKGELIIHTTFTGTETHQVQTIDNTININQIIEAPDITEDCHLDSYFSVIDLECKPRFDLSGDKNLLDISAVINFSACGYKTRTLSCVRDAYSTKYESEIKKNIFYLTSLREEFEDSFLCRGVTEINTPGISKILSFLCTDITSSFSLADTSYSVNGEITAEIIYEDVKGEICFIQRQIPYTYKRPAGVVESVLSCNPHCNISAFSYVLNGDKALDIRAEINIRCFVFAETEKLVATDLVINKDKIKSIKTAALTIYFADSGEAIWDIAERYNTTVEAITRENHLTESCVKEKCKLLIPKM